MVRLSNEVIRRRLGVEAVLVVDNKEWKKNIEEIPNKRLVGRVLEEEVCGRRPRGQPRKRCIEDI